MGPDGQIAHNQSDLRAGMFAPDWAAMAAQTRSRRRDEFEEASLYSSGGGARLQELVDPSYRSSDLPGADLPPIGVQGAALVMNDTAARQLGDPFLSQGSQPAASAAPRSYSRSRSLGGRRRKSYGRRSYGRRPATNYRVRAAARRGYIRGKWPSSVYAHPYIARGSAAAQALGFTAGQTFQDSSPAEQAARRQAGWYGRGQYMQGNGGYIGSVLGGLAGGAAGLATIAAPIFSKGVLKPMSMDVAHGLFRAGAAAGSQAEDWIRNRLSGRGDYGIVTNSLVTGNGSDVVPSFGPQTDSITITNKEYMRDVYCPLTLNAFQIVDAISLNPGLGESFPSLSQIAMNFEEYEFIQLAITFKSTIDQSLATNGQSGQIALTTSYNPGQDPFGSKQEMMSYSGGMSCKSNQSMIHGIECDPSKNSGSAGKFVRPGFVVQGDLKNYDLGTTYLSVLDAPTQFLGVTLGELWVSYTVVLRKPKLTVGENYNVGRAVICSGPQPYGGCFGVEGDMSGNISVKSTLPVTFVRVPQQLNTPSDFIPVPTTAQGGPGDEITYWTGPNPFTTVNVGWDIKIVFPPWFSGIICIKRVVQLKLATGGTTAEADFVKAVAFGQIFRYADIPIRRNTDTTGAEPPFAWSHVMNARGEILGNSNNRWATNHQIFEMHLRVLPSNNGVQNEIYFSSDTGTTAAITTFLAYMEVSGYNTYLSVDDAPISTKNRIYLEEMGAPGIITTWP